MPLGSLFWYVRYPKWNTHFEEETRVRHKRLSQIGGLEAETVNRQPRVKNTESKELARTFQNLPEPKRSYQMANLTGTVSGMTYAFSRTTGRQKIPERAIS